MSVRYVRVLTALFAAITLHALLLSWSLPSSKHLTIRNGLLHVDLLEASRPATAQSTAVKPLIPNVHAQPKPRPKRSVQPQKPQPSHQASASHAATVVQRHNPLSASLQMAGAPATKPSTRSPAIKQTSPVSQRSRTRSQSFHADVAGKKEHLTTKPGGEIPSDQPATMTAAAQSILLANIHYPPIARRHGWQGKGEFQLAIVSQSIRNITMLGSTGHAVLDRAARLGLASVGHIAVADGKYRLPVEFRLQ